MQKWQIHLLRQRMCIQLQQSNAMANENKLSDASLSQINEATQSMLDLGKMKKT